MAYRLIPFRLLPLQLLGEGRQGGEVFGVEVADVFLPTINGDDGGEHVRFQARPYNQRAADATVPIGEGVNMLESDMLAADRFDARMVVCCGRELGGEVRHPVRERRRNHVGRSRLKVRA